MSRRAPNSTVFRGLITLVLGFAIPAAVWARIEDADIPIDAPADAVMANPEEIQPMLDWAGLVFAGRRPPGHEPAVGVEVRRQDHSVLHFGQSCIDTPIRLGQREFKHGLGTHANSEIALHLPPGAREFKAVAGIDNNSDTGGVRGSVRFSVEIGGKEMFHTPILHGNDAAAEVTVALPDGTRELTLKTDATPDGPGFDQADWADACIVAGDGRIFWADEDRQPFLDRATPFSFKYGGASSADFLRDWPRNVETQETPARTIYKVGWTDPKTGLKLSATVTAFKRYPAVEWVLTFENSGSDVLPPLEDLQALDARLRTGYARTPVVLHQLVGDVCGERSFQPTESEVELGKPVVFGPEGGRSSNGAFPFFNIQYAGEGMITAIGWSGQWRAAIERSATGPTSLRAGMEKTSIRLRAGEKIRTPRVLVCPWKGDRITAHNRFRRLLLFEYVPKQNGRPWRVPIALQCFDRYVGVRPDWGTESAQLQVGEAAQKAGCDTHWLDAAWFLGGFPNGVGNWFCPSNQFPRGLKPISDASHRNNLEFLVWFEPERVAPGSQIAREHPEFVLGGGGPGDGLFKLNDAAARQWMADLLSTRISEYGIDVYRNDFNIDPLGFWRQADPPDRQGITEIGYVEGHYALWDELLARHPGLRIDNCASGGRRIDLETCKRSLPLWHSDTGCAPGHADWNQSQCFGLGLYVPLFGACAWTPAAYDLRSAATAGLACQFAVFDSGFNFETARAALAEAKENQKYWYGDFYPLSADATGTGALIAWQLHRSDLDSGIVLAFRRADCPYPVLQTGLRGLKPDAAYAVEYVDENWVVKRQTVAGKELASEFELRLPQRGTSLLVRYRKKMVE